MNRLRKVIALVLMVSLFPCFEVSAEATYNVSLDFSTESDLEKFTTDDKVTTTIENGKLKVTNNGSGDMRGFQITLPQSVKEDLVVVSFKMKKPSDPGTHFKMMINGRDSGENNAILIAAKGNGAGSYMSYHTGSEYVHLGDSKSNAVPCDDKETEITMEYDLKNGKLRIFEDGIETNYYKEGLKEEYNNGEYMSSRFQNIDFLVFAISNAGNSSQSSSVEMDDILVMSGADYIKKRAAELTVNDVDKALKLYEKAKYYKTSGYDDIDVSFIYDYFSVLSNKYSVNYTDKKISEIPWGTSVETLISNITAGEGTELSVMRNNEIIETGSVLSQDILKASAVDKTETYVLDVIPANTDTNITSEVYTITDDVISGVYVGASFGEFMGNIVIHPLSKMETTVYKSDYKGSIDGGFNVIVTAEAGNSKTYTVSVRDLDDYSVELESEDYVVDNTNNVIYITNNVELKDFTESIVAKKGEKTKLLDEYFSEKVSGQVIGCETLRVYKVGSVYERVTDYSVVRKKTDEGIVTHEDNAFQVSGSYGYSTAGTGLGVEPIVLQADDAQMKFSYNAKMSGEMKISLYTVYHDTNGNAENIALVKNGVETLLDPFNHKVDTGFHTLTTCDVNAGDNVEVVFKGLNHNLRLCGVKFSIEDDSPSITGVSVGDKQSTNQISVDNVLAGKPDITLTFSENIDVSKINTEKIQLISQNGYKTAVDVEKADSSIIIRPQTKLKKDLVYNCYLLSGCIPGENIPNVIKINMEKDSSITAKAKTRFYDAKGYIQTYAKGAKSAEVLYSLTTEDAESVNNVFVCVYNNGKLSKMASEQAKAEGRINLTLDEALGNNSFVKVFMIDATGKPIEYIK